jgi:dihydroxyacetone kinase
MIVVRDDVALNGSGSITGPRGLAGTVFIHKIAGAAAFAGSDDSGRIGTQH